MIVIITIIIIIKIILIMIRIWVNWTIRYYMWCTTDLWHWYHDIDMINDSCFVSQFLKPIMFDDDTSSFYSNKEIKPLFLKANLKLGIFKQRQD